MLLSSNQVLRYVNALAVTADGLSRNNIEPAEGAFMDNILNIFAAEAWPQMDQTFDISPSKYDSCLHILRVPTKCFQFH